MIPLWRFLILGPMSSKDFNFSKTISLLLLIFTLTACSCTAKTSHKEQPAAIGELNEVNPLTTTSTEEYMVYAVPLPEVVASTSMEFSGLAWHDGDLVLLPQYPHGIMGNRDGVIYAIPAGEVENIIADPEAEAVVYAIEFDDDGLRKTLAGFEGFESLVFIGDTVFLTIETHGGSPMKAFLVKGGVETKDGKIESITLFSNQIVELSVQNSNRNASYEAITTDGEYLYAFYEQYGYEQNPNPYVVKLDQDLNVIAEIPIDPVNYRLTDAGQIDRDGYFGMINYFFPGDEHLQVSSDPISVRYGLPESHLQSDIVERLLRFKVEPDHITLVDEEPVYLRLPDDGEARNWEGFAEIPGLGFFVVTDSFPNTMLGLIKIR